MPKPRSKIKTSKPGKKARIPAWSLAFAVPVILLVLFYILHTQKSSMDWAVAHLSKPVRTFLSSITSWIPFSLAELLITVFLLWLLFFIVRTVVLLVKRPGKLRLLGRRLLTLLLAALYIVMVFAWLWGTNSFASGFSSANGLNSGGVTVSQLVSTTVLFAQKASALSSRVTRDASGHFAEQTDSYFPKSAGLYNAVSKKIPALSGPSFQPKKMVYSKVMSVLGFTGIYFPFTGEANINVDAPACLIPFTVAHELAHQRGVSSEQEANFVGVLACVTSDQVVYEYSGYLSGLIYLMNSLGSADPGALAAIQKTFPAALKTDLNDNNTYWAKYASPAEEAAATIYDGYLKVNNQPLGMQSYGACVDLLVHYFAEH